MRAHLNKGEAMNRVEFDSTKKPLDDLLKKAHDGSLQLPDFQRGWVWEDERLRGLLASVARSFPVGALLTLQAGGEVKFAQRLIEGAPKENEKRVPDVFLLDGQQRITSLYQMAMRSEVIQTTNDKKQRIERWYFIDMEAALADGANRDSAIVGIGGDKVEKTRFGREIVRDLSTPEKEYRACMFPTHRIFSSDEWQTKFAEHWNYDAEKLRFWFRFQNEVLAAFRGYMVPVIELGKSTSREAVCLIFEKVNMGGKALDAFELLTAIFAAEGFLLRKDWYGEPESLADKSKPVADAKLGRYLRLARHPILKGIKSTDFLQAITLLHTLDQRRGDAKAGRTGKEIRPVLCTRDAMLNLPRMSYERFAPMVEKAFVKAATFLRGLNVFEARDVPYPTQLVPLSAMIVDLGDKWENHAVRKKVEQWFWCGVFGELYGSTVETRFARDVVEVPLWVQGGAEPSTVQEATFRLDRLDTMRSRLSAAYKGVHSLLKNVGAKDFGSGEKFTDAVYASEKVDVHHIFPQKWCKSEDILRARYDSIVNKTPLTARTNKILGGSAPSIYLKRLLKKGVVANDADMDEVLKTHAIDPALLRGDAFDASYAKRREALLKLIEQAMGKAAYRGTATDEPVIDVIDEEEMEAEVSEDADQAA